MALLKNLGGDPLEFVITIPFVAGEARQCDSWECAQFLRNDDTVGYYRIDYDYSTGNLSSTTFEFSDARAAVEFKLRFM